MRHLRIALGFAIALLACQTLRSADDAGFLPLVQGDDPAQFELVGFDSETISIRDGEINLTGKPNGYFATKKPYKNYVLRFEWKYEAPAGYKPGDNFGGNSGLLVHIQGGHKVWPKCTEVQLAYGEAGHIFAINGAKFTGKTDQEALKKARKPVGEWNQQEVTCKNGEIICAINGLEIARGTGADPDSGSFGFQSEGKPIQFRKMMIKTLD
jgi:hypothetical protein